MSSARDASTLQRSTRSQPPFAAALCHASKKTAMWHDWPVSHWRRRTGVRVRCRELLGQCRGRVLLQQSEKERVKKPIYKPAPWPRRTSPDYIDTFDNRSRRHSHLDGVSPEQLEAAHKPRRQACTDFWELHGVGQVGSVEQGSATSGSV
jgi:hypothetical protein